jgi:hypothetical protein
MTKAVVVAGRIAMVLLCGLSASQVLAAGSLALDSNQGDQYGFAYDYPSTSESDERALSECGGDCQVVMQFESGCAAYAADQSSGSTVYGWYTGTSGSEVQSGALSECAAQGGSGCQVRVWGCNSN